MGTTRKFIICCLLLAVLLVYLFATAPPPLSDIVASKTIPIRLALELLQQENAMVRELYTKEIVGEGKKRHIDFDENWKQEEVHAGLLPAQFLRETARHLERSKIRLGLFLGSDFAINQANVFDGEQKIKFAELRHTRKPVYFYYPDAQRYTYMFPDVAVVKACVECHNDHKDSPKDDWQLYDVMGATTWTFPQEYVSTDDFIAMIAALRDGFRSAYKQFLKETRRMPKVPLAGELWPRDGYYVPSESVFMKAIALRSSMQTLDGLLMAIMESGEDTRP